LDAVVQHRIELSNTIIDYQNSGATEADILSVGSPSLAGLLNRIDQSVSLDFQWHVAPETMAFVGGSLSGETIREMNRLPLIIMRFYTGHPPVPYLLQRQPQQPFVLLDMWVSSAVCLRI
jgi:hypothetical protein